MFSQIAHHGAEQSLISRESAKEHVNCVLYEIKDKNEIILRNWIKFIKINKAVKAINVLGEIFFVSLYSDLFLWKLLDYFICRLF